MLFQFLMICIFQIFSHSMASTARPVAMTSFAIPTRFHWLIFYFKPGQSVRQERLFCPVNITCGVPQGSNLGHLLFLICINDLPNCLERASPRMFADGTNIRIAEKSVTDRAWANNLLYELKNLHQWLITNRLSLNVAKTEFIIIRSHQRLLVHNNKHISIEIDNKGHQRRELTKRNI